MYCSNAVPQPYALVVSAYSAMVASPINHSVLGFAFAVKIVHNAILTTRKITFFIFNDNFVEQ
jgi:hypothetical protein